MKSTKLLIITFLFSSFLTGCGMKGPLYRVPANANEEKVAAAQGDAINTTTENPDNSSENRVK